MKEKRKILVTMILLLSVICVTVGVTFAAFSFVKQGTVENTIETGTVMLTYTEGKTGIILEDALPIADETGKMLMGENNVFDFTVTATLGKSHIIGYEITAVKISITDMTPLEDNEVVLYLERAIDPDTNYQEIFAPSNFIPRKNKTEIGSPTGSMVLDAGTFTQEGTTIHNYRLRMWVDEEAEIPNGEARKYGVKINVYAKQLVLPEESCFTFDESTGTITDYSDTCPKDVVIPDMINNVTVLSIGEKAFYNNRLTSVIIPFGVTTIEYSAFSNNQLMNVTIPNSVTTIGYGAFKENELTSLVIPDSVTYIGEYSFSNNQLTNLKLGDHVLTIREFSFANNQLTSLAIPDSVTMIEGAAFNNNQLNEDQAFVYKRNSNGSIDYQTIVSYGGSNRNHVVIPNTVTTIGRLSFYDIQLTNVTIPYGVTSIEYNAFAVNQLTSVVIPDTVKLLSGFGWNQLISIDIPDNVTEIGDSAFAGNKLTDIVIPSNVISIEMSAFANNQLASVTIGSSVTSISSYAFNKGSNTNPNLTKIINKTGRSFDWKAITNGSSAATFVIGIIPHSSGDITVTSE